MKMKKILTAFFLAVMLLFSLSASAASLGPKIRVGLVVDQYSAELSSAGPCHQGGISSPSRADVFMPIRKSFLAAIFLLWPKMPVSPSL